MSRAAKLFARFNASGPIGFAELVYLAEALGFILTRQKGSHRIYRHATTGRMLNLQPDEKTPKPISAISFALLSRKKACNWTTDMPHYHVNIFWSDRDVCWIADVPDLKYCSAHGDSVTDAAREIEVAMTLWLETATDNGDVVPKPLYRPDMVQAA